MSVSNQAASRIAAFSSDSIVRCVRDCTFFFPLGLGLASLNGSTKSFLIKFVMGVSPGG